MIGRKLAPEEAALWARVIASVRPLASSKPIPIKAGVGGGSSEAGGSMPPASLHVQAKQESSGRAHASTHPNPSLEREGLKSANTLDGTWDRQLSRGLVTPESTVDLHGHSLTSAYDRLDRGLAQAIGRGDRVLLLVTGKPPARESERPHARGAIRAAVGDWLAASRHAGRIAAVRPAHLRHGGTGALYIVLRRQKPAPAERNF